MFLNSIEFNCYFGNLSSKILDLFLRFLILSGFHQKWKLMKFLHLPYREKIWHGFSLAQGKNEIFGAARFFLNLAWI